MKLPCSVKCWRSLGLAMFAAAAASALGGGSAQAAIDCTKKTATTPIPKMTVKIYNNSTDTNIYPVLSTGTAGQDEWLLTWCELKKAEFGDLFWKPRQFRFYVKPDGDGIPPGGSATLTIPLLTQLEAAVDGKAPKRPNKTGEQVIDWWGGGRIELFESPNAQHKPPQALLDIYKSPSQKPVVFKVANTPKPSCVLSNGARCGVGAADLAFFVDDNGLKNSEPSQLTEYTLGAIKKGNKDPWELVTNNVDIDVSYVDTAYLPAAMEPYNNVQVGYVGTTQSIPLFRTALRNFLTATPGWPQFLKDPNGSKTDPANRILKVPSLINLFGYNPDLPQNPDISPRPWPVVTLLQGQYTLCRLAPLNDPFCARVRAVDRLIEDNYKSYVSRYKDAGFVCDRAKTPVALSEWSRANHAYGWTPWNENCANPRYNLLENTPATDGGGNYNANNYARYQKVKQQFDELQYWKDGERGNWCKPQSGTFCEDGRFDPYVLLIHAPQYAAAANAYAYSVDDAVGNLQADGDGFIIAVGGAKGLPNPNPASAPVHVPFGGPAGSVRFVKYGVCSATPDRPVDDDFRSFDINSSADNIKNCVVSLLDNKGRIYRAKLKRAPALVPPPYFPLQNFPSPGPNNFLDVDCSLNLGAPQSVKDWCARNFVYSEPDAKRWRHYFVLSAANPEP